MTDLEKYKQLFDETNVGYTIENRKTYHTSLYNTQNIEITNATVLQIEAGYLESEEKYVNGGYYGFFCNLVFNENGKLIKFDIFE